MGKWNNPLFFWAAGALITALSSCGSGELENQMDCTAKSYNKHTLIFVDKTLSVQPMAAKMELLAQRLRSWVSDSTETAGDRFYGQFIHQNTLGIAPFLNADFREQCPDMKELKRLGGIQRQDKIDAYHQNKSAFKRMCNTRINEGIAALNPENTRMQTNLWATLEVMSRFFANARPGDKKYVIYVSDMVESMKGPGRRDFDRVAPKDKAEAQQFAKTDVAWIRRQFSLDEKAIHDAVIYIWAPAGTMEQNKLGLMRWYWEVLFKELGVKAALKYD